jgi:hypothetical protein
MNMGLEGPESDWPSVLFLDVPEQGLVIGDMRSVVGMDELDKQHLATMILPECIRRSRADRFGYVMPAWRHDEDRDVECLVLVVAEPDRREAVIADVFRDGPRLRLGPWSPPTQRVDGLFAEPLCRALLAKPRHLRRHARSGRHPSPPTRERKRARVERGERQQGRNPLRPVCPDCGVAFGRPHRRGCDVERCTVCFGQRLLCECKGHDRVAAAWRGEWPGAAECRALGWWAVRTEKGWRSCPPESPGAREDLNRLAFFFQTGYDRLYDDLEGSGDDA